MKKSNTLIAGASSISALVATSDVNAAVVTNVDVGLPGFTYTNLRIDWDIDNSGSPEATLTNAGYLDFAYFANSFGLVTSGANMLNIGAGVYINAAQNFENNYLSTVFSGGTFKNAVGFTSEETGYIGFRFNPTGTIVYGWAEVVLNVSNSSFEVVSWAYEDSGTAIQTPVPEPASAPTALGLLALGAAGVRRWRGTQQD